MSEISHERASNQVGEFVQSVRRRLNWCKLLSCILWATAVGGTVMLCVAIGHVGFGNRVSVQAYAIVAGCCGAITLVTWWLLRNSDDLAAYFADRHFALKDAVKSCRNFSAAGLKGGFYSLQAAQTESLVARQSLESIRYRPSYRLAAWAGLMVIGSVALGFKGPSQSVLDRMDRENATLELTASANQEIRELVDELDRSIDDPEERRLLAPDELRQWVDELDETKDHREALRQYARLERLINRAAEAMQQRRDEQLLDTVAEDLKKETPTRELGDLLKQKKYDKAAEELKAFDPQKQAQESGGDKKLSDQRKELAKLKAAAQRMADAARRSSTQNTQIGNQKHEAGQPANEATSENRQPNGDADPTSDSGQATDTSDAQFQDGELDQMLEELEESVEELDEAMELTELEEADLSDEEMEECEACRLRVHDALDKLGKKLLKMARNRSAQAKLKKLGAKCTQCQSSVAQSQSPEAGGKKAGQGSSDRRREDSENPEVAGPKMALQGIKGEGPALTIIQSADDGTGVSGRTHQSKVREFQRQFESFVAREDIPEDLRSGVKDYFIQIHQSVAPAGEEADTDLSPANESEGPENDVNDPDDQQ